MPEEGGSGSTFRAAVGYIGERVTEALRQVDGELIAKAVALIGSSPTIFVYGAGRSGIIARAFAMRLVQTGLAAFVIGESVTPIVKRGDLVIIFSNKGESYSSLQTANIVRREGASLIVITARESSKLAHIASLLINLDFKAEPERLRYAPLGTLFEAASLRLSDGLIAEVMKVHKETESTMRQRHAIMV